MKKYNLILFVFLALVLTLSLSNVTYAKTANAPANATAANGKILDPGDVVKNSTKYAGNTVTVRGTVDKIFADGVFTLKEHKVTAFSNLLVIFPNGKTDTTVAQGSTFIVTGEVRGYSKGDLDTKYGIKGANPKLVSSYDNKVVLIGSSIRSSK